MERFARGSAPSPSSTHCFGSALNRHVHLHACVTDGVFTAADMLAWENSGFSIDASVRISLTDRDVPGYFQSLVGLAAAPP